jgi:hypothetical protein
VNPIDPGKAFADFWVAQGEAWMKTRAETTKVFVDAMRAFSPGSAQNGSGSAPADLSGDATELERASRSLKELWSKAATLSGGLVKAFPAATNGDATIETTLVKMFDPRAWLGGAGEMDDVLGRMAEGPRFADLWDIERRYARVLAAWMTVRRRGLEHQSVVLEAWVRAGRRFNDALAGRADVEEKRPDAKSALALWSDTANQELLETQRSEPFLKTQAAMIRASTELRLAQHDLVEYFGRQYGFPTRTELDDVHRAVTDLRRELRAARRERRADFPAAPPDHDPRSRHDPYS